MNPTSGLSICYPAGMGCRCSVAAIALYVLAGGSWWLFAVLILAPDLSMLGYLAGPRVGAVAYNALHILSCPLLLALAGYVLASPMATAGRR